MSEQDNDIVKGIAKAVAETMDNPPFTDWAGIPDIPRELEAQLKEKYESGDIVGAQAMLLDWFRQAPQK